MVMSMDIHIGMTISVNQSVGAYMISSMCSCMSISDCFMLQSWLPQPPCMMA